jgi:hypothetical protein
MLALLLFGFALRLYHLGGESLWYDETVSVYLATQPLTDLIAHTARDIHPPAYYLLLYVWRLLSHPTVAFGLEFLYAWPNLCLDLLVMALTYAIAKRFFNATAARWALALALFHPTQIWFTQEVRMYALGAFCLMLTLWAASYLLHENNRLRAGPFPRKTLILYPIAALLGLYTLYYFLFWLAILNLCIVYTLRKQGQALRAWLALQLLILVGWLPWLPTFIHQALTPPVPAWRVPWQNATEIAQALSEAVAALWVGQFAPLSLTWPWTILMVAVGALFYFYTKSLTPQTRILWLVLSYGPLVLLLTVSIVGPPIYHVRYIATYAPVFVLLLAALLANLRRIHAILLFLLFAAIATPSLQPLWASPRYAADDHRSAVETLAHQWRPGDAILVNAGWVYTAIAVYWPTELPTPDSARPPAIANVVRLSELGTLNKDTLTSDTPSDGPLLIRTGSVNGTSSLGWGLPESDFFAITAEDTTQSLAQLAATHTRIWHYRLYDTVSDPNGTIRHWLNDNTTLELSEPIPGRDFLRLERYRINGRANPPATTAASPHQRIDFPDAALTLLGQTHVPTLPAGETLYVNLSWLATNLLPTTPSLSLRLYDAQDQFLIQSDTPLTANETNSQQSLALPIPADIIPGIYKLALVVYAPDTLAPYPAIAVDGSTVPSPLQLGDVTITLPITIPHTPSPLATFDYIDLLQANLPTTPLAPGASLDTAWIWRPQPSDYRDRYIAHLQLVNGQSPPIPLIDFTLGGDSYPSSAWPALYPLKQRVQTHLPDSLASGSYQVLLSLTRASDGQAIGARQPWQPWHQPAVHVGELTILEGK